MAFALQQPTISPSGGGGEGGEGGGGDGSGGFDGGGEGGVLKHISSI